jgi:hypothetical protein
MCLQAVHSTPAATSSRVSSSSNSSSVPGVTQQFMQRPAVLRGIILMITASAVKQMAAARTAVAVVVHTRTAMGMPTAMSTRTAMQDTAMAIHTVMQVIAITITTTIITTIMVVTAMPMVTTITTTLQKQVRQHSAVQQSPAACIVLVDHAVFVNAYTQL